jgi:hypothetical protein
MKKQATRQVKTANDLPANWGQLVTEAEERAYMNRKFAHLKPKACTRYLVFNRPEGSLVWTLADRGGIAAGFSKMSNAHDWVRGNYTGPKRRLGWHGGNPNQIPMEAVIVPVRLPK